MATTPKGGKARNAPIREAFKSTCICDADRSNISNQHCKCCCLQLLRCEDFVFGSSDLTFGGTCFACLCPIKWGWMQCPNKTQCGAGDLLCFAEGLQGSCSQCHHAKKTPQMEQSFKLFPEFGGEFQNALWTPLWLRGEFWSCLLIQGRILTISKNVSQQSLSCQTNSPLKLSLIWGCISNSVSSVSRVSLKLSLDLGEHPSNAPLWQW